MALEFAIVAVPWLMLTLGTMEVGYDFFVQAALDNAVHVAARGVQTGGAQGTTSGPTTGTAAAAWVTQAVCPALGGLLSCTQLYVSVAQITVSGSTAQNYYNYILANPPSVSALVGSGNSVCTGNATNLMMVRAFYLSPTFLGLLVPAWSQISPVDGSSRVHVSFAASGFVNEFFSGGQSGC